MIGYKKHIFFAALFMMIAAASFAGAKKTKVFLYGFAASFNDSTVYFTDIQVIDTAVIESRTKFLYGRENYSYQLRDYLKEHGCKTPTCITTYSLKQKSIEKKYIKFRKKYPAGKFTIKHVTPSEFKFTPVGLDEDGTEVDKAAAKAAAKKAKADAKKARQAKKQKKDMQRRGVEGRDGTAPIPGEPKE